MPNIVYVATSIDGYIAKKDNNIDWLNEIPNPENSDYGYSEFINTIDAIIMGRKTFEVVSKFKKWPYNKPVFVLSNKIKKTPNKYNDKIEIVNGELKTLIASLNKKGFKNLYIDGGRTIQSFLKENLIDEITITTIPIILGSGIPLFKEMDLEIKFKHVETQIYNNSLVKSKYVKIN